MGDERLFSKEINLETNKQDNKAQAGKYKLKQPYQTPKLTRYGSIEELTLIKPGPSTISDRNLKEHFAPVDTQAILDRVAAMPIETWNYKFQDPAIRHIGPMAQDFAAAFAVGDSDKTIHMLDANGVSLAAIQALYAIIQQRDDEIASLRADIEQLKQAIYGNDLSA